MNYRTDTETINDLRTELAIAYKRLDGANRSMERHRANESRAYKVGGISMLVALAIVAVVAIGLSLVAFFQPLSSETHARARAFCRALAKQDQDF